VAGQKAAKKLGEYGKEVGKMELNVLKHPILTTKANYESKQASPLKDRIRRELVYSNTKEVKDVNSRVDALAKEHLAKKEAKETAKKELKSAKSKADYDKAAKKYTDSLLSAGASKSPKAWLSEAGKVAINGYIHPIITNRANTQSKQAGSFGNEVRRTLLYQNTNDLRDVNQRIYKAIADKKAKKL